MKDISCAIKPQQTEAKSAEEIEKLHNVSKNKGNGIKHAVNRKSKKRQFNRDTKSATGLILNEKKLTRVNLNEEFVATCFQTLECILK